MQFECMTKSWISDSVMQAQDIWCIENWHLWGKLHEFRIFLHQFEEKKTMQNRIIKRSNYRFNHCAGIAINAFFFVLKPKKKQASIWHWISQTKQQLHFLIKMQFFNRVVQVWIASVFFRSNSDCHEKTQTVQSLKTNVKFQTNKQTNRN